MLLGQARRVASIVGLAVSDGQAGDVKDSSSRARRVCCICRVILTHLQDWFCQLADDVEFRSRHGPQAAVEVHSGPRGGADRGCR